MRRKVNLNSTFEKTMFIDKNVEQKITYWMLKILVKMGGYNQFVSRHGSFDNDELALYLNLGEFIDNDDFDPYEPLNKLKIAYNGYLGKTLPTNKRLQKNITNLGAIIGLNSDEEKILEFFVLFRQYDLFARAISLLGNDLNTSQSLKILSTLLEIPTKRLNLIFRSDSRFSKTSLVTLNKKHTNSFYNKFELIDDNLSDYLINSTESIETLFRNIIKECGTSSLTLGDYEHIKDDIDILVPYLKSAFSKSKTGVNILLYGHPGTGKTELCKVLAKELSLNLSEISYADEDDEAIDGKQRLKAYKIAQSLLRTKNTLLMYDEAEDIFDSGESFFTKSRQKDKAWINRILETNTIPTIWISNNINSIDNAIIRRFDIAIEVPIPAKKQRREILKSYTKNILDGDSLERLALHEKIAPALISRASSVVANLDKKDKQKSFEHIINNTLKAQGYKEIINQNESILLPNSYDTSFVNCDTNLQRLSEGIQISSSARMCIYGPAGTGKSAYAKYLASSLDKPLILKKGSDLLSMYVGGTEKNIARAFLEAKEENGVLVFDEVDSFLADRGGANRSWEITQVNEMLVQMENFNGIFIATTNLMDNLDSASLRRFDLKMEFSYLKPIQSYELFKAECMELHFGVDKNFEEEFYKINSLTPGDFAAVKRQNRFKPLLNANDFLARLKEEVAIKKGVNSKRMGFL